MNFRLTGFLALVAVFLGCDGEVMDDLCGVRIHLECGFPQLDCLFEKFVEGVIVAEIDVAEDEVVFSALVGGLELKHLYPMLET